MKKRRKVRAPRKDHFVREYLVDLNATQAAIRCGYSAKTANRQAARLLSDAVIKAAIQKAMDERAERTGVTVDRVLKELGIVGFSSIWHYQIDDNGHVVLSEGAPEEAIRAVSSIKRRRRSIPQGKDEEPIVEIETEIKLWDKPATLRLAGQHLGMYTEKHEHSGKIEGTGVLAVPVPPGSEQWGKMAASQQEELTKRPPKADVRPET